MGKKADHIRAHYNSFEQSIREALQAGDPLVSTTLWWARERMRELAECKAKLQNTPTESKAGAFAIAVVAENEKALASVADTRGMDFPDRQARVIEHLKRDLRDAQTYLKRVQEALDRQQRSWEPVSEALGQQGHESTLDAAQRVVADRDEARAALKAAQESLLVYVEDAQRRAKQSEDE